MCIRCRYSTTTSRTDRRRWYYGKTISCSAYMPSRCEIKIRVSVCFRVKLLLLKYTDNSCIINVVTKDRAGSVQTVNQHHPCRALIVCNAPHPRRQPHAALLIAEVAADRQPVSLPACLPVCRHSLPRAGSRPTCLRARHVRTRR